MSLTLPEFWYPFYVYYAEDPRDLFHYAQVVLDYPAAALVCALALGFQIHLAIPILRGVVISKRRRDTYGSSIVLFANATLAIACIITTTLYCVGFILMLQSLGQRPRVWPESPQREPVTIDSPIFLTSGRRAILQMVAVGMQFMVLLADTLLIYRCWVIFNGKRWVCVIPSVPYAISLGLSVYGVVLSARGNTSWEDFVAGELVAPYVSAVASFFVNVIVTSLICLQILRVRRRTKALMGNSNPTPGDTLFVVAIIVESALPASCIAVYVPVASFFTWGAVYASRVAWVACTALAPQLIAIRVMKRRDIHSVCRMQEQVTSIQFGEVAHRGESRAAQYHGMDT